jgi:uncharacterized protein (TIGR02679 family)
VVTDVPKSLLAPSLSPLWLAVQLRLSKNGTEWRGGMTVPDLGPTGALALASLLGIRVAPKRMSLANLEGALAARSVADDLASALGRLGFAPSTAADERRVNRSRSQAARNALREVAATWPEEWAAAWADEVVASGALRRFTADEVERIAIDVRRLIDRDRTVLVSRAQVAASVFGSSHALDAGTRREAIARRALQHAFSESGSSLGASDIWESGGILTDRVSAPVLTWRLPAEGTSPVATLCHTASDAGLPVHLSLLALQSHPVVVRSSCPVLVVENPQVLEAAVGLDWPWCVIAANGNPSTTVVTLVQQLVDSGASVRYHGDFDSPGIAICRRMAAIGAIPWEMSAAAYRRALNRAEVEMLDLLADTGEPGPTPWDPGLAIEFSARRFIIHEEYLIDELFEALGKLLGAPA